MLAGDAAAALGQTLRSARERGTLPNPRARAWPQVRGVLGQHSYDPMTEEHVARREKAGIEAVTSNGGGARAFASAVRASGALPPPTRGIRIG